MVVAAAHEWGWCVCIDCVFATYVFLIFSAGGAMVSPSHSELVQACLCANCPQHHDANIVPRTFGALQF